MNLLPEHQYQLLEQKIKEVTINNLFARAVIEKQIKGKIFVDNVENPKTFYVVHPYNMSLLFGDYSNFEFNQQFKTYALNQDANRDHFIWMQTFPREWDDVITQLMNDAMIKPDLNHHQQENGIIELHSRVNFEFNANKYLQNPKSTLLDEDLIVETDAYYFEQMPGSVIPLKFWNSASDFEKDGKGYTLLHNGEIASTAYSAFVNDNKLEIGIETVEKYRGCGYAQQTCSRLIDYCLENKLTPVWSCRYENKASYQLAQKLGFEPTLKIPFYRLSK